MSTTGYINLPIPSGGSGSFNSLVLAPTDTVTTALTVMAYPGSSVPLIQWLDQNLAAQGYILPNGQLHMGADSFFNGMRINGLDDPNTIYNNGNPISITTVAGVGMRLDTSGNLVVDGTVTSSNVLGLSGLTAGDWATSVPTTLIAALNRMSALLKTLNGGTPIP